ncbi:MAG: LytTR family DNA-binding domain-containing protein [Bacteroidia bacterium]|nr:LytTR family DNA-binding domain-containing protein [Bacteroidia bacterium]
MRILILEDELPAAQRLESMIRRLQPDADILPVIDSVETAIAWLDSHPAPDLAFFDIQLSDGLSLEILENSQRQFPVIFATAFDEYALQAFKAYSVDYLLKPIKEADLEAALEKFRTFRTILEPDYRSIRQVLQTAGNTYQQRILLRLPEQIKAIDIQDIAYFYIESRLTFMQLKDGKSYPCDYNLEQLEERVDPSRFFRINRQFLIGYESIDKMYTHTKSRVVIKLHPTSHLEAVVSSERASEFKHWLQG